MVNNQKNGETPGAKRITVRDVAAAAGVHFTTVSMALRNHPRLPVETRNRIRKIADQLGYRPDPMLTALNAYRDSKRQPGYQATIGWINNWPERKQLLSIRQFREYFEGATARAQELGYVIEEFWLQEPGMTPEKLHRILAARNIDTLLIAPQPFPTCPKLNFLKFSAVVFGYSLQPSTLHVITSHHTHSMNLIMRRVFELGYRRVGLIFAANDDEKAENVCQDGMALATWRWPEMTVVKPLLKQDATDEDLSTWLETERPDAVISHNSIADRLRAIGYRFPKDVGFVSIDLKSDEKVLSGIYQNDDTIGRMAVDLVVAMLHRGERGLPKVPVRTLVESVWMPGKTLTKQRRAALAKPM